MKEVCSVTSDVCGGALLRRNFNPVTIGSRMPNGACLPGIELGVQK